MNMTEDYGNSFFGSTMYSNEFSEDIMTFWQYTDYFCPWHGAATAFTPSALYDPVTSDWRNRGFEFGIVNIPNPAYTNAAHKNGVMSIACVYFDPSFRPGQTCKDLVGYDNWQDVADQLIAMAAYYGYDGYFMNQEEGGYTTEFKQFMSYLTAAGLWTQWYDTNGSFNSSKAQWLKDDTYGKIHDSVFVNYSNFSGIDAQLEYAKSISVDPYKSIFYGVECNQAGFSGGHSSATSLTNLYDANGNPRASYALFCGSDNYHRGLESINSSKDGDPRPTPQKDGYQWMSAIRQRMFWSGVKEDPTDTGRVSGYSRGDVGVNNASGWVGVADFIAERSVISGTSFYTNFNTGHGMQYFVNGEVRKDEEWANINIQEMMPTWQWWFETTGSEKLSAEFDYGTALKNKNVDGSDKTMDFTQVGAYNGGSSLAVYGKLDGTNTMHLFKTDLTVNAETTASVTFKKISSDDGVMKLALTFKDDPENPVILPLENTAAAGEWTTSTVNLSSYNGREIAAISLVFEGTSDKYQINVGNVTVSDGNHKPAAPSSFTLQSAYADGQMIVTWDKIDYSEVVQYNLYGKQADGSRVFLGGIYGSILYVKNSFAVGSSVELQLCAVGVDGTESDPATITFDYNKEVSDVQVEESLTSTKLLTQAAENDKLSVSFKAPAAGAPDRYEFEVKLVSVAGDNPYNKTYTGTADGSATSAVIDLPVAEGYKYDLTIFAVTDNVRSEGVTYRGSNRDHYSEPLELDHVQIDGNYVRLVDPDTVDWQYMTVVSDGRQIVRFKRGTRSGSNSSSQLSFNLPSKNCTMEVTVTDFSGNVSAPTTVVVVDGKVVDLNAEYGEDLIPDVKLRAALRELVGPTIGDLLDYSGDLNLSSRVIKDLTGLNMVSGVKKLNLNNNFITEITSAQIPSGTTELTVGDCANLTTIELNGRPDTALILGDLDALTSLSLTGYGDHDLDLTGCPKLVDLDLTGTAMKELDTTGAASLENLFVSGSSLEKLNITDSVKLHNLNVSNSKLSTLTSANADKYTNAYRWQFENNLLDLSDSTNEGTLKNGIKNYFDTTDIPLEIGRELEALKRDSYVYMSRSGSQTYDLGKECLVGGLDFSLYYYSWYNIGGIKVSVSTDGETYTDVAEVALTEDSTAVNFDRTAARYVKITNTSSNSGYFRVLNIMGYTMAPKGFTYGGQKPAVTRDAVKDMTVAADNTTYRLLDLLDASYASTKTLNGNLLTGMTEADWIDASYLAAQTTTPANAYVTVTDENDDISFCSGSNFTADTVGNYVVTYISGSTTLATSEFVVRNPSVDEVIALIDAIGTPITVDSKAAIDAARTAYNNLATNADRDLVTNYETLTKAESEYLALADKVEALIDKIGNVTLDSGDAITAAREAYDGLTAELQELVDNYDVLVKAENDYAYLMQIKDMLDKAEAAKDAAEAAQKSADEAKAAAEEAKKAAEEAANSTAADKEAAAKAAEEAKAAQEKAEAAQTAADEAKTAAQKAQAAAEAANEQAAEEAKKAAEEAAASAASAAESATSAADAAKAAKAAQEAQAAAEEAQKKAEDAQKAAEDAAAAAGEDKTAAEAAQKKAEEAQAAAEEAKAKAEEAKKAAEDSAKAAEESNTKAAEEAKKAAEEAAKSASSATEAAASAAEAAEAQKAAQNAQAAAEAAQKKAEDAAKTAEEAKAAAEKAAQEAGVDSDEAKKAADASKAAQDAAEAAKKAAEDAASAAEASKDAADKSNKEAAQSAELAAKYAKEVADAYAEIVKIKAEIINNLAEAQKAAAEAKKAALDSAKYYALIRLSQVDTSKLNNDQKPAVAEAIAAGLDAVDKAETPEEVEKILADTLKAIEEIEATKCAAVDFTDVKEDAWYHDSVDYLYNAGIISGTSKTTFGTYDALTRGQLVTILYRLAGEPEVEGTSEFTDVPANAYYTKAVIWAAEQEIAAGYDDGTFAPNAPVNRQELVVFLYRYAKATAPAEDHLAKFTDADNVSGFAVDAMNWAVANGLISGVEENVLSPKTGATRAQFAAILTRYLTAE